MGQLKPICSFLIAPVVQIVVMVRQVSVEKVFGNQYSNGDQAKPPREGEAGTME